MIRLTAVIELEGHAPRALTHESNARSILLGRDSSAAFQIPLSTISRRHLRISETDGVYFVEDLGSTHGTIVNGVKLDPNDKRVLRHGDIIELTAAKITCAVESERVALADPGEGTQAIAARAVEGILGRLGDAKSDGPFFRAISGPDEGARYSVSGPRSEWTLGRSRDCDFVLNDPNISRRHAVVRKDWNGFSIDDLSSKNGVLINGRRLAGAVRLNDRDEIDIGPIKLLFLDPDAELLAALKDVPGFDLDEARTRYGPGDGPEGDEIDGSRVPPLGLADDALHSSVSSAVGRPTAALEDATDLGSIDPDLLRAPRRRQPFEWLLFAGVSAVIVVAVVLLFAILG